MSEAVFFIAIVYPPTLQFVTISFILKNATSSCIFYIYLAKPPSKAHVSNSSSNTMIVKIFFCTVGWSIKLAKNIIIIIIIIVITTIIIYSLNIALFNIKMIKSTLHEFKNIYKNTITIMNYMKYL